MSNVKQILRERVDQRIRDSIWAFRSRGDASVASAVMHGALGVPYAVGSNREHLQATMLWLCAAQDATADHGVSAFYDVRSGGWGPSYPETTGYIIPTFFDYATGYESETYRERAVRMADWLLSLQLDSGAFPIGPLWPEWERAPIVFDTGQIIQGLVRAFIETSRQEYLASANRAGNWLVEIQDEDGCWRKFTSQGHVHTYNVRTAWALLQLSQVSHDERQQSSATRNLAWALTQQDEDGWYRYAGFTPGEDPLTHTIVYTIEGILESGVILNDRKLIDSARCAADSLLKLQTQDGFLHARYGAGWKSQTSWSCLTGDAQMALVWQRLYQITGEKAYLDAAVTANHYLKQRQPRYSDQQGVVGGIAGSYPIYEGYEPYRNLNWAAKFFADSLLLAERLQN
jgi:hypothetical protein